MRPSLALRLLSAALLVPAVSVASQNRPIVQKTVPDMNLARAGGTAVVSLGGVFVLEGGVRGPIVRQMLPLGPLDFELFPEVAPATVANFRKYVREGDYDNTFIHRSVPGFVIQGGGYVASNSIPHIPTDPPVLNEYQRSNQPGTVAMAKLATSIHSATSEWFVNLAPNDFLDGPGQRFTVFGRCIGGGFQRSQAVAALPIRNLGSPINELPLFNYTPGNQVQLSNLVKVSTAREIPLIPATGTTGGYLTLSAQSSNPALLTATLSGTALTLRSASTTAMGKVTVTVRAADAYGQSAQTSFAVNVVNPALPVLSITAPDALAREPSDGAVFRISRTGSLSSPLTVKLSTSGGTALAGSDFTAIPAEITIPAGSASRDIAVTPVNDSQREGVEDVRLTIQPAAAYTLAPVATLSVPLRDDDVPDVVVGVPDADVAESPISNTGRIRIARTGPVTAPLSVPFTLAGTATAGSDFIAPASPAVIPAGSGFVDLIITAKDDTLREGLERVTLKLTQTTNFNLTQSIPEASLPLFDNETPNVTLQAVDSQASEPGSDTASVRVTRNGDLTAPLTVFLNQGGSATWGIDYAPPPAAITIPAGQPSALLIITPRDDSLKEAQETILVSIVPGEFYNAVPGLITVQLLDND